MSRHDVLRMVKRRCQQAQLGAAANCHTFRATGITAYLLNGGTLEHAQQIAAHESPRTTKLYDRTTDEITLDEIERIMDDPKVAGGYFRIRLPHGLVYRLTDSFAHYAGILLRIRCGDHGIFCRRTIFVDIGGFPEVPLMEDVEFLRRLRRCGRVKYSERRILVSPRRYESVGSIRLTLAHGVIATLYIFGVPLSMLASIYKRMCCDRCSRHP